jgi:hypothetical protein
MAHTRNDDGRPRRPVAGVHLPRRSRSAAALDDPAEDIHERRPQAASVQVGRATSSRPMLSLPTVTKDPPGSSGHKVFCLWPHSLQAYSTRPWSTSALTRLGAPHLLHFTSSRVLPCVMVTFRVIASLTKRSDSWRIASFDIAGARGFRTINSPPPKNSVSSLLFHRAQIASFPLRLGSNVSPANRRINRSSVLMHPRCNKPPTTGCCAPRGQNDSAASPTRSGVNRTCHPP